MKGFFVDIATLKDFEHLSGRFQGVNVPAKRESA
jgi:hypothetical protein